MCSWSLLSYQLLYPGWPLEHLILPSTLSIICHCLRFAECEGSRVLDVCPFVFLYPLIRLHELCTTSLFTSDGHFFLNSLLYIFAVGSVFVVIFFRTDIKKEFCAKMTDNQFSVFALHLNALNPLQPRISIIPLNHISNYDCIKKSRFDCSLFCY